LYADIGRCKNVDISFIIPAHNEENYLGACLASLITEIEKNGKHLATEIIVVDNASTDRTGVIARNFAKVRVVVENKKGVAHARQCGLEAAKGKLVAYLDADTYVPQGWLAGVIREFNKNPEIVCLTGPFIYYDLPRFWREIALPCSAALGWSMNMLTGCCVVGGNMIMRRDALVTVGGFNRSIPFYGEDLEAASRLSRIGKIKFVTDLNVLASARRFNGQGIVPTTALYAVNFLSVAVTKQPLTASPRDFR
jgi:glycosyltransferase involved in cell wall biosynthesis